MLIQKPITQRSVDPISVVIPREDRQTIPVVRFMMPCAAHRERRIFYTLFSFTT